MSDEDKNSAAGLKSIVSLLLRQRWWVISTSCLVPLIVVAVVMNLPNRYTSEATLVIVQQQISQRYVDPTNTMSGGDAVKAMKREVLSQARLLAIIDGFGLYAKERTTVRSDRLVERVRKAVNVEPLDQLIGRNDFTAFSVSFTADTPRLAQEINSRLTSLFIEENLKARGNQASSTKRFLSEQLDAAKQRLTQQEQKLQEFRLGNLNALPEQEQSNLGMLTDLRMQLQNAQANLNRLQQQKISLESWLNGNRARLQSEKASLLTRYTPKHAEVVQKDKELARTDELLTQLRAGAPVAEKPQGLMDPEDPAVAQLRAQVTANLTETDSASKAMQRLNTEVSQYQARLRLNPIKQQQLAALLRDYELYKQDYTSMLNKQLGSQLTANLEERQEGQQFRLVDPPTLPSVPSSPKRLPISLGGAVAGVVLGVALAFVMDSRAHAFHTENEIRSQLQAPLVVGLPVFYTPAEERKRTWRLVVEWVVACSLVLAVAAAEFYVVVKTLQG